MSELMQNVQSKCAKWIENVIFSAWGVAWGVHIANWENTECECKGQIKEKLARENQLFDAQRCYIFAKAILHKCLIQDWIDRLIESLE